MPLPKILNCVRQNNPEPIRGWLNLSTHLQKEIHFIIPGIESQHVRIMSDASEGDIIRENHNTFCSIKLSLKRVQDPITFTI